MKVRMVKAVPPIPTGDYKVKVVGVQTREDGKFGPTAVLNLEVIDNEEFGGKILSPIVGVKNEVTPKRKLSRWLKAFGVEFNKEGDEVDIEDDLLDREALATVTIVEKGGVQYNRVTEMRPLLEGF